MKKLLFLLLIISMCLLTNVAWANDAIIRYKVQKGDCISKIARRYHQPAGLIAALNNITLDKNIKIGDSLLIPLEPTGKRIVLKKGDNPWDIARRYNISPDKLLAENDISDPKRLMPGDILTIATLQNEEEIFTPRYVVKKRIRKPRLLASYRGDDKFLWPVRGEISSNYGTRGDDDFHHGLDIAVDYGTAIISASSGRVVLAGYKNYIYGNAVEVISGPYKLLYGHCSEILVTEGQMVSAGETIAKVGSTGRSTGPHVHFQINTDEGTINPMRFLN